METKLLHVSQAPMSTGLPKDLANPIKPELFVGTHEGRLGKLVGMTQFGVNLVTLDPGSQSALRHWHDGEDEFVYVLSGTLTLIDDNGEHALEGGSFAGFPAGSSNAHHLVNKSQAPATYLAIGLFFSTCTRNQIIAGLSSMAVIGLFFFLPPLLAQEVTGKLRVLVQHASLWDHHGGFVRGMLDLNDVLFFASTIVLFLFLSVKVLESKRWR